MRFLVDQNLSSDIAGGLRRLGHEADHVEDIGMSRSSDAEIMARALSTGAVVVSADTDFGELLARANAALPSLVLLRRQRGRRASDTVALLEANLAAVAESLTAGAVVVLDDDRLRIRPLPFRVTD